jgi:hypothetical protein
VFAASGEKTELGGVESGMAGRLGGPPADLHSVPNGDRGSAVLKCAPALANCDVVVGVSSTEMECARRHTYTSCKFMQLLDAIRHQVIPRITVLGYLGIVDINHFFLLSPPGRNLALRAMCDVKVFLNRDREGFPL